MDLIRRCRAGDEEAFAILFDQYKNLVYKTAYLLLDSSEDAEDALQEVFLQVHRSLARFDPAKGNLTTWLYRLTVNHCLNRRRKGRSAPLPLDDALLSSVPHDGPSPDDQIDEREALRHALAQLTEKQRTLVILRYYGGLSYAEIAQVLDIPVGTVRSRLNQATRMLRKRMQATPAGHLAPSPFRL